MPFRYAYIKDSDFVFAVGELAGPVEQPNMVPISDDNPVAPGWTYNGDGTFTEPAPTPEADKTIRIGLIWERMTDAEQDQILAADEGGNYSARRFMTGLQAGSEIKKGRVYPIVENQWGAARAAELLADEV